MSIELSICIPTYNRSSKCIKQIESVSNQLLNSCELIISDNNSDPIHKSILSSFISNTKGIEAYWQEENLGLVGNLEFLVSKAKGRYIWLLSDDDEIEGDAIQQIIQKTLKNPGLIYLNHVAYTAAGICKLEYAVNNEKHKSLSDVLAFSGTTVMLISASVYQTKILREIYDKYKQKDITFPLRTAFLAEDQAGIEFSPKICLKNIWGDESWGGNGRYIFFKLVPVQLLRIALEKKNKKIDFILSAIAYYFTYLSKIFIQRFTK